MNDSPSIPPTPLRRGYAWLCGWGPTILALGGLAGLLCLLLHGSTTAAAPTLQRTPDATFPAPGGQDLTRLTITLRPRQQPSRGVAVIYELRGPHASFVRALTMSPRWAKTGGLDPIAYLLVRDAKGLIDTTPNEQTGRLMLSRPVVGGVLRVSYLAQDLRSDSRLALHVDETSLSAVGYGLLALPELTARLAVRLRWELDSIEAREAATSFAVGRDVVTVARPVELAHSLYLAGDLRVAENYGERLIAMGPTRFDLEEGLRFCSETLHAARQLFNPNDAQPHSFVFLPQSGLGTHYEGTALHRSFGVWFDETRPLDTRMRVLVAHEITHHWIGGTIRFSTPKGEDARWFSEGFTVHFARWLLLRSKLISPADFLDDLQRDLLAQRVAVADVPARAAQLPRWTSHASPEYYRGALYAARVQAQLSQAGQGGLHQLIGRLLDRVPSPGISLPEAVWRQTVVAALGPDAGTEFDRLISDQPGALIEVPGDAFGPCLERLTEREPVFDLGFERRSLRQDPPTVQGLESGSNAARAGLRNGMVIVAGSESIQNEDPRQPVRLVVQTSKGATRRIRFLPQRWRESGTWQVADRPECTAIPSPGQFEPVRPSRGWLMPSP